MESRSAGSRSRPLGRRQCRPGDQQNNAAEQDTRCGRGVYIPESYPNREWMVERLEKVFEHLGDGFRYA